MNYYLIRPTSVLKYYRPLKNKSIYYDLLCNEYDGIIFPAYGLLLSL